MCMRTLFIVVAIGGFLSLIAAAKLPSYLKQCKTSDLHLNKCIVKNGQEAIPRIVKGDRQFNMPLLDPFTIPEVRLEHGRSSVGLSMILRDVVVTGLKSLDYKKAEADLENGAIKSYFTIPRLEIISKYEMNGKILVLPITGKGDGNITMEDIMVEHMIKYDQVTKEDGLKYMNITHVDMKFSPSRAYFKFDNLFNGDKFLGDNMNTFLNENWKEVSEELNPNVVDVVNTIVDGLAGGLTSTIPFKEIFPD